MFKWLAVVMLSVFMVGCAARVDYNRKSIDLAIGMNKSDASAGFSGTRRLSALHPLIMKLFRKTVWW